MAGCKDMGRTIEVAHFDVKSLMANFFANSNNPETKTAERLFFVIWLARPLNP